METPQSQRVPMSVPSPLFFYINEYGQLAAQNRLVFTAAEVAEILTISAQKVRWMILRGEIPFLHLGSRRVVSLNALEHYVRTTEIEEQQDRLSFLERYHGYFGFGTPHQEIQDAQERLDAMQQRQGSVPSEGNEHTSVSIEAALYHISITDTGRLECTPRWLLSMAEAAQLLGMSRSMLWALHQQGDFPAFHIQKRIFVRVESFLDWIRRKEHPEHEQPVASSSNNKKTSSKTPARKRRVP